MTTKKSILEGGENEEDLSYKRSMWFWESRPRKIREDYANKQKLLDEQAKVVATLKTELGTLCAKRRLDETLI